MGDLLVKLLLILLFIPSILSAEPLQKTLQTLHETYAKVNDITADFSQSVTFEGFDTTAESKGKVYFKRGKMRWDYSAPTKQQIFVEGETLLHYTPENQQVVRSVLGKQTGLPIDLFISIEKIEALFHRTQVKENTLILKPKGKGSQVADMVVTLAPLPKVKGLFIKEILIHEENGNQSKFKFTNFKINKSLSESFFSFKIPDGVEVIVLQ